MTVYTQLAYLVDGIANNVDISSNTLHINTSRIGTVGSYVDIDYTVANNLLSLQNGADYSDGTGAHTHDGRYYTSVELSATTSISGASLIGIFDTAEIFNAINVEAALHEVKVLADTSTTGVSHLVTLTGVAVNSDNLGIFTGITIPDNSTIKDALQALETHVDNLQTYKAEDSAVIKKSGLVPFEGPQSMGGFNLTSVATPVLGTDAANKNYVDTGVNARGLHTSAVAATVEPLSNTYSSVVSSGSGVGKTLQNGDVSTTPAEVLKISGIYKVSAALAGTYFTYMYLGINYYVWFIVDGLGADPAPGGTSVSISASTDDLFTSVLANAVLPGLTNTIYNSKQIFLIFGNANIHGANATVGTLPGATLTTVQNAGEKKVLAIDNYYPAANDRIIIKDEVNPVNNGIYVVANTGYGNVAWVITRATDCDGSPTQELSAGHIIFVQNGQANNNSGFVIKDYSNIIVDTDPIYITEFTGLSKVTCTFPIIKNKHNISFDSKATNAAYTELTNGTLSTINAGTPVYVKTDGTIAVANAVDSSTSLSYIGITAINIASNTLGYVAISGESPTVTISGTPIPGDRIYLDTIAGTFTNVAPVAINSALVLVGIYLGNNKIAMQTQFIGINN